MQYPQIALSPSRNFYFVCTDKGFLFVKNGETTKKALDKTTSYYKNEIDKSIEDWKLLALPLTIRAAPRKVIEFLIHEIHINLKENDLVYATNKFTFNDTQDKQVLADIVYSINENYDDGIIEFNETNNNSLNSINLYALEKTLISEFTKNKKHKRVGKLISSLSTQLVKSYVANGSGITFQLLDNSKVSFGYEDFSDDYLKNLEKYL
jgi:hypothetical protein